LIVFQIVSSDAYHDSEKLFKGMEVLRKQNEVRIWCYLRRMTLKWK
jgi:hypothetical protein